MNYTLNNSGAPTVTFVLQHNDFELLKATSEDLQLHLQAYDAAFYVDDQRR